MRGKLRGVLLAGAVAALAGVFWVAPQTDVGAQRIQINGRPNYGTHRLTTGFTPDPFPYRITAGGGRNPIDISGSNIAGCPRGYVTPRPDFRFVFEAGTSFPLLRFYVVTENGADALLLINEPNGNWRCNDDHGHSDWGNSLMPAIDYNNPPGGRYDIWVGTYELSRNNPGTLFVTELAGNHP